MARTDIHSPLHLVTEDYEYWGSYDGGEDAEYDPISGTFSETQKARVYRFIKERGLKFAATHGHNGDQCDHCGAHLRYVALMLHKPTNTILHVGENCLSNRFEQATAAFHAMRKSAELARESQRIVAERSRYFDSNPSIEQYYHRYLLWAKGENADDTELFSDSFLVDLMRKLKNYGSLSEKQTPWVVKCVERAAKRVELEAERAAEKAVVADVEEGTYEFSGTVVAIKLHESDFGSSFKMTVKADDGRVYWGTVPRSLEDWWDANTDSDEGYFTGIAGSDNPRGSGERNGIGVKVTIKATVTKSDKDRTFGFFKRPRLVSVTDAEGTTNYAR